jgi:hypothetical protein
MNLPTTQVLAPLPIGFAVFMVHLATIPITGTGINPARSLGAAVIYNTDKAWDDQVCIHITNMCHLSLLENTCYLLVAQLRSAIAYLAFGDSSQSTRY